MTYLELVNRALKEAGVKKQPLTSATFASPVGSEMYDLMKSWVAEQYENIQIESDEQEYMQGHATIIISPRIHIKNGNRATAPEAGSIFEGQETGTRIEVISTTTETGTWLGGDAVATIDFEMVNNGYTKLNEYFDEVSPGSGTDIFQIENFGRYNFADYVTDLEELRTDSVFIQATGGSTIQPNDGNPDLRPLMYKTWPEWSYLYEVSNGARGVPYYFTTVPDGQYDLWPRPDKQYVLSFNYNKTVQTLTDFDDIPDSLPATYHMYIVWRAVMEYADYDRQDRLWAKAKRQADFYKQRISKRLEPMPTFGPNVFVR